MKTPKSRYHRHRLPSDDVWHFQRGLWEAIRAHDAWLEGGGVHGQVEVDGVRRCPNRLREGEVGPRSQDILPPHWG